MHRRDSTLAKYDLGFGLLKSRGDNSDHPISRSNGLWPVASNQDELKVISADGSNESHLC